MGARTAGVFQVDDLEALLSTTWPEKEIPPIRRMGSGKILGE